MTALELLATLRRLDVTLTPWGDRLRVNAPQGVLTDDLSQAIREHKTELLDLMESFEERAAIAEYCSGLLREAAERLAWDYLLSRAPDAARLVENAGDGMTM
jgi:hypothetical protein